LAFADITKYLNSLKEINKETAVYNNEKELVSDLGFIYLSVHLKEDAENTKLNILALNIITGFFIGIKKIWRGFVISVYFII